MKITLLLVGKTDNKYLETGISEYVKRLQRFVKFDIVVLSGVKGNKISELEQKREEAKQILSKIDSSSLLILLDENGKTYSSRKFAKFLSQKIDTGARSTVFLVGGPYGFSEEIYQRADGKVSLSEMTFSHQMIRLFFVEQLYRAFTIITGHPYHHD